MTVREYASVDNLPLHALWQWIGVATIHAAHSKKPPYLEPLLREAIVIIHQDYRVSVQFADGTIVQLQLGITDTVPEGGITLPIFV